MVIETVLAREWENWSDEGRWWSRRSRIAFELAERTAVVPRAERGREELRYFADTLERFASRRYQPPVLGVVRDKLRLLAILDEALDRIERAAARPPPPDAPALQGDGVHRLLGVDARALPTAAYRRFQERLRTLLEADPGDADPAFLGELVALVRQEHQRQLDSVVDKLAKVAQKPDHCVRRACAGTERDRLLPRDDSWDDDWYVGPDVTTT
jgi:hypothetical protein